MAGHARACHHVAIQPLGFDKRMPLGAKGRSWSKSAAWDVSDC